MTTLPLDLPALREGAEEMAREYIAADLAIGHAGGSPLSLDDARAAAARYPAPMVEGHARLFARLLADLTRPASRDWWVRWGIAREQSAHDGRCLRHRSDAVVRWDAYDRAQIGAKWSVLRDDPEALRLAVLTAAHYDGWSARTR